MRDDQDRQHPKKHNKEPFGDLMKSMNDFFHQKPVRRLLDTIDDFFEQPFPPQQIPVDMYETDHELIISADLPGIKREQIGIDFIGNQLTITVNHNEVTEEKNEKKHYYYKKVENNQSIRTVTLPYNVHEKDVKATYQDGVLKIRIPRQRKKRIMID